MNKKVRPQVFQRDITDRDYRIVRNALLYAITAIQNLPEEMQEFSDMCDMVTIYLALVPRSDVRDFDLRNVQAHMGLRPDLTVCAEGKGESETSRRRSAPSG